ncbi:MAG: hypothetical protein NTNFB02_33010 [Nitrospira sp.]
MLIPFVRGDAFDLWLGHRYDETGAESYMTKAFEQTILEKLRSLPPERLAEVEDFVDFLAHRQADEHGLTHAAGRLAVAAFTQVWDNPADADYDRL